MSMSYIEATNLEPSKELDPIGRYEWFGNLLGARVVMVHESFNLKG